MRILGSLTIIWVAAGCVTDGTPTAVRTGLSTESVADPAFLEQFAVTRRFTAGLPTTIKVTPDGSAVLFLRSTSRSFVQDLYEFDVRDGEERLLLTAENILSGREEELSPEERARRERMRMSSRGIVSYQLSRDGTRILVPLSGRLFVVERGGGRVTELTSDKGFPIDAKFSPDGTHVSCVRDGELYVMDLATRQARQLTTGATEHITRGVAEFVAQEEMDRFEGYWWSPDGKTIAYQQTNTSALESMHIADAMHPDRAPQTWPYPRPGKANAFVRLGLIPVDGGHTQWVSWDYEKYPYLATVKWKDKAPLTILVQNREQTEEALLTVDPDTGSTSILLVEKDDAWLNLDQDMPWWTSDGTAFFWTTERGGARQLVQHARDGRSRGTVSSWNLILKKFLGPDPTGKQAFVLGGDDPTQTHIWRCPLDLKPPKPVRVTDKPGSHSAVFAENHSVFVQTSYTLDGERAFIVRRASGEEIGRLKSVAEQPPFLPNLELTTVGTNPTFHAAVIRPRNFVASRRYPVLVSVYGGPGAQTVMASPYPYLLQQWMVDHGFIVVSIDGRGTPSRGRDWERVIKGNLIDIPLADQVAGLQALGRKYREMDLSRVGIYGWSFGGYFSAMAVMRRPDVYHVGVAGAPVCDWLDYDTHYTERYLGLPDANSGGYSASSVLTYAPNLQRPLLIIHGTADDNVYLAHSLKMSNALFRAGKAHDFLALSDFTHMVADPLVTTRLQSRIIDFFTDHLID